MTRSGCDIIIIIIIIILIISCIAFITFSILFYNSYDYYYKTMIICINFMITRGDAADSAGRQRRGEVPLRGVGTLRYSFPPNASVQWQPDGLTIHAEKWLLGAGFLGAPPISLRSSRSSGTGRWPRAARGSAWASPSSTT